MAWSTGGKTTLSGTADTITVNNISDGEFLMALNHIITSGNVSVKQTFNNDTTANNYGYRISDNGTTDVAGTAPNNYWYKSFDYDKFTVSYICNISGKEKLSINFTAEQDGTGKTVPPERREGIAKWVGTSSITRIDVFNSETGDYLTDSNLTVLNGDTTEETILGGNIQSGSRFEATDTRKIYYGATPSLTLDENFSSDNWTDNDSTYIGVSGGVLTWSMKRDATNDASVRDLGFVVSDKWVLRFKVTQGSSIGSTQAGNGFFFGISDSNQSVAQNASQDFVGMAYYYDNQSEYNAMDCDGTALPHLYQGDAGQNITISANDVFYFEIIKNGSSYTVEGFTNSDYSTGSLGKISGTTTATGLRYLKIMNELTNGSIPTSTNPFNGTIDDLKFYNGFTNTTDFVWTEEA